MTRIHSKLKLKIEINSSKISILSILISVALFMISVYSYERAVYSRTIEYLVPSGDDIAYHSFLIRMFKENIFIFTGEISNAENQYPSLFHVILGVLSIASGRSAFFIPKLLGIFLFIVVIVGLALWLLLFKRLWNSWSLAVLTLSLLLVLSPRLLQTVGDGSYPHVLTVFTILPLTILLIHTQHIFLGGMMLGLAASTSYAGFIVLLTYVAPLLVVVLVRSRSARSILLLTAGSITGGLLFVYRVVMFLIPLLLAKKPLTGQDVVFSPFVYGWYMFPNNEWFFYMVIIVAATIIVATLTLKADLNHIWIPASYFSLLALASGLQIGQERVLRDIAWISSLIIGEFSYQIMMCLTKHIDKAVALLIVIAVLFLPLITVFQGGIQDAYNPELIRLDEQRLSTYIFLKNYLLENNFHNVTIYSVAQVSSWAPFYITDWSRNISQFYLQPFSSLEAFNPNDPYVAENKRVLKAILNGDIPEPNKTCFLLVESPIRGQWHISGIKELTDRLLLIYSESDREKGVIFKVEGGDYNALIYRIDPIG